MLQHIARDLAGAYPDVDASEGVCGGEPCIVRTRTPVWLLVQARRLGSTEVDLLRVYPGLRAEDLTNAWSYYRPHREEIDHQVLDNEEA